MAKGVEVVTGEANRAYAQQLNDQMSRWRARVDFTEAERAMLERHTNLPPLTDDLNLLEIIRVNPLTVEYARAIIGRLSVFHREYHNWLASFNALPSDRDKSNLRAVRQLVAQRKQVIDAISGYLNWFLKKERTREIAEILQAGQETGDVATYLLSHLYQLTITLRKQGKLGDLSEANWRMLDAAEVLLTQLGLHTRTYGREAKGEEETN